MLQPVQPEMQAFLQIPLAQANQVIQEAQQLLQYPLLAEQDQLLAQQEPQPVTAFQLVLQAQLQVVHNLHKV